MPFSPRERKILMNTRLVGKKTVGYLEALEIDGFRELKTMSAELLGGLIAHHTGLAGWATHPMALQALSNAIAAAKEHFASSSGEG